MTVTFAAAPNTDRPNQPFAKRGVSYDLRNVYGVARSRDEGPQVFLVEQVGKTDPHFHQVPQFQVFVGGEGTFGRSPIGPRVIHYADAWTTYGPITYDNQLFGPYEDGLGAQEALLGPNSSFVASAADNNRLVMVVAGNLVHETTSFAELSWVAITGNNDSVTLRAGADGAMLAVLDYPKP